MTTHEDDDPWRGLKHAGRDQAKTHGVRESMPRDLEATPVPLSKFRIPRLRPGHVDRRLLQGRIGSTAAGTVTVVAAPPGFGKTTLVAGWLMQALADGRHHAAWLTVDEDDSDPTRFIADLTTAVRVACPGFGSGSIAGETPAQAFSRYVQRLDKPLIVVIDDLHRSGGAVDAIVAALVDETLDTLRVVILTRHRPGLPLARWRARGELQEVDQADLAFNPGEVRKFLARTLAVKLPESAIALLEQKTEGWAAGLQMAALSPEHHAKRSASALPQPLPGTFSGTHRFVVDYFAAWLQASQPAAIQRFLARTSILRRLCAANCAAVAGFDADLDSRSDPDSEQDPVEATLREIDQSNLFVVRLDDERHWYRYHGMFAEALRSTLPASEATALHRRASAWYEANGDADEAFHHAREAADIEGCVRLFRQHFEALVGRGDARTARHWLSTLPPEVVERHADLAACQAWFFYLSGSSHAAQPYAEIAIAGDVDRACGDGESDGEGRGDSDSDSDSDEDNDSDNNRDGDVARREQRGWLLTFRAYHALNWGGPGDVAQLARRALQALPSNSRLFRVLALNYGGQGQAAQGLGFAAAATLLRSYTLAESYELQGGALGALLHLVCLMIRQGKLREARELAEHAVSRHQGRSQHPPPPDDTPAPSAPGIGIAALALGAVALEADELPFARRMIESGLVLCERLELVYFGLHARQLLARVLHASGDTAAAWRVLMEARALADATGGDHRRAAIEAVVAELQMQEDQREAAAFTLGRMTALAGPQLSDTQRVLCARSMIERGEIAEAAQAAIWLDDIRRRSLAEGLHGTLIDVEFARARMFERQGDAASAVASLNAAARIAGPAGYRRVIANHVETIARITNGAAAPVDDLLLDAMRKQAASLKAGPRRRFEQRPVLTPREVELLALLNLGLRNGEIADQLHVTLGTIKQYANQLYRKLGARNRIEAVLIARDLQIHG